MKSKIKAKTAKKVVKKKEKVVATKVKPTAVKEKIVKEKVVKKQVVSSAVEPPKRMPWVKKPMVNLHATPAGPCYSLRERFDSYIGRKYTKANDEQKAVAWKAISMKMLTENSANLIDLIDNFFSKK
jgi:hypothetical protein